MDISTIKQKLQNFEFDGCTITNVDYSGDPDFMIKTLFMDITADMVKGMGALPFFRVSMDVKTGPKTGFIAEVWLPEGEWNERLHVLGNGGKADMIAGANMVNACKQPMVLANCNLGTGPNPESVDNGCYFPGVWADFGWRATHLTTLIAKKMVKVIYGKEPRYSYFSGSSTGGQQAISMAENFPEHFDGILTMAPAIGRTYLHVYFVQWVQKVTRQDGSFRFTLDELKRVSEILFDYYHKRGDGAPDDTFVTDSFLSEVEKKEAFKLLEDSGEFSEEQLAALKDLYTGPINPRTGERIYQGIPLGSEGFEMALPLLYDPIFAFNRDFLYPCRWGLGITHDQINYHEFDLDKDVEKLARLTTDLNADTCNLDEFKARGGKMIMTAGAMDALVPPGNITNYYERVVETQGGLDETKKFFRHFIIPGYQHVFRTPNGIDWFCGENDEISMEHPYLNTQEGLMPALMDWVEKGIAPESIKAVRFKAEPIMLMVADPSKGFDLVRPVYPYPDKAEYIGGDSKDPSSFKRQEGRLGIEPSRSDRYWTETKKL